MTYEIVGADGAAHPATPFGQDCSDVLAMFDTNGLTPGSYDVRVTSNGATISLPQSLRVSNYGGPTFYANIIGRQIMCAGCTCTFTVAFGNAGNTDGGIRRDHCRVCSRQRHNSPWGGLHCCAAGGAGGPNFAVSQGIRRHLADSSIAGRGPSAGGQRDRDFHRDCSHGLHIRSNGLGIRIAAVFRSFDRTSTASRTRAEPSRCDR